MYLSTFNTSADAIACQSVPQLVMDNWQPAWLPTDMSASDTSSNYSGTDVPPSTPIHATLSVANADPFASQFAAYSHQDMSINAPALSHDEMHALLGCPFAGSCYHAPGACLCHSLPTQPVAPSTLTDYSALHNQYSAPLAPSSLIAMTAPNCGPASSHSTGMSFNGKYLAPIYRLSHHSNYHDRFPLSPDAATYLL